nr:unnamed protein product [Digitaria exilis]
MAATSAPLHEYWHSRAGSMTLYSLSGYLRYGLAQSTRFCSRGRRERSTDCRPESSSSSTTPKLYTSLLAPLVVTLNCLEDPSLEQDALSGAAAVEHAPLSALSAGRVEAAAAVLVPSLAFLPRAAQRRLRPWQLLLCLGSPDRAADAAAAAELGLRLVHVDANRAEEGSRR